MFRYVREKLLNIWLKMEVKRLKKKLKAVEEKE